MAELSDDDRRVLERLRQAAADRDAIPEDERTPVEDPERYSFPIGVDDEGRPYPPRDAAPRSDKD
jgi:hypothetical protein